MHGTREPVAASSASVADGNTHLKLIATPGCGNSARFQKDRCVERGKRSLQRPSTSPVSSKSGAAICRVRDSRDVRARKKAAREHGGSPLCCEPALIVCPRRITSRRGPAYIEPARAAPPGHTLLPNSGETESPSDSGVSPFRKAPRLYPTSAVRAR